MPITLSPNGTVERGAILTLTALASVPSTIAVGDIIRFHLYRHSAPAMTGTAGGDGFLPVDQAQRNLIWNRRNKVGYIDVTAITVDSVELPVFEIGTDDGSSPQWTVENITKPWGTTPTTVAYTNTMLEAALDLASVPTGISANEVHFTESSAQPPNPADNNYFTVDFPLTANGTPPTLINATRMGVVSLSDNSGSGATLSDVGVALWDAPATTATQYVLDDDGNFYFESSSTGQVTFYITGGSTPVYDGLDIALANSSLSAAGELLFVNLDDNGSLESPGIIGASGDTYNPPDGTALCPIKILQQNGAGAYVTGDYIFVFNKAMKRLLGTVSISDPTTDLRPGFHPTLQAPLTADNFYLQPSNDNILVLAMVRSGAKLLVSQTKSYLFSATSVTNPNQPPTLGNPTGFMLTPELSELGTNQNQNVTYEIDKYGLTIEAHWDPSSTAPGAWKPIPGRHQLRGVLYLNGWQAGTDNEQHTQPATTPIITISTGQETLGKLALPRISYSNIRGYGPRLHMPPAGMDQSSSIQVQVYVIDNLSNQIIGSSPVLGPLDFTSVIPGIGA